MEIVRLAKVVSITALLFLSSVANADVYFGIGTGIAALDYEKLDGSSSNIEDTDVNTAYAGFKLNENVALQLAYLELDETLLETLVVPGFVIPVELAINGYNLSAVYTDTAPASDSMSYFLKAGIYNFDTELKVLGVTTLSESSSGLSIGAGFGVNISKYFMLYFEAQMFDKVEDFQKDGDLKVYNAGIQVNF